MCGIVGYVGNQQAQPILLQGLEKLEYRGYDSAGIYVVNDEGHLFKEVGRIAALEKVVDFSIDAHYGIGHTRWATHGVPSFVNAHPHQSPNKRFTLVHNGVIENYKELKETYLSNVALQGETDTEIVVSLIEHFSNKLQADTKSVFKHVLSLLKGSYAFGLIDSQTPNTVFASKNKSPLLIGVGDDFHMLCSDAMAGIEQTNQFIEIMDGELVVLTPNSVTIENKDSIIKREPFTANVDKSDLEKGTYPHYMLKEIDEQPAVIRQIISNYFDINDNPVIDSKILNAIKQSTSLHIIACGTSYHAGLVGKHYLETISKIPTHVHIASEFTYNMPLLTENPFFIFISQSGETADSRQALVQVNENNYNSLTITNVSGSTLSRESTYTLLLHAGPEIAVASTKAYTAQIAVLAILASALSKQSTTIKQDLSIVSSAMESVIDEKENIHQLAKDFLTNKKHAFFIGRHLDYFVSLEAALKLKEISYIHTEGFAAGELKHGTIALIEKDTPVFAIITQKQTALNTRGNVQEVKARGANACVIAAQSLSDDSDNFILPDVSDYLAPLVSIVVTQLIAYYITLELGFDIDKPRNLAKSVTVE